MILPLMIFIVSCETQQKIYCAQIKSATIKPLLLRDINFQFNRCRIRCFDVNTWGELPFNQCAPVQAGIEFTSFKEDVIIKGKKMAENYPIELCDGIAGFTNTDMAVEIKPKIKKLNSIKNDLCGE